MTTVCTPRLPLPGAQFHSNWKMKGVRAGGKRVFACADCGDEWAAQSNGEDFPPSVPPQAEEPPEAITDAHRQPAEKGGPPQKVEALPMGSDPNQVLLDSLKRVAAGETTWVVVVEIGPEGVPAAHWSIGPVMFPLAAAQAMSFESHAMLASMVPIEDDEDHAS